MEYDDQFEDQDPLADDDGFVRLPNGKLIIDHQRMLPYLRERPGNSYAWRLIAENGGLLGRLELVYRHARLAVLFFGIPFIVVWLLGRSSLAVAYEVVVPAAYLGALFCVTDVIYERYKSVRTSGLWTEPQNSSTQRASVFKSSISFTLASALVAGTIFANGTAWVAGFTNPPDSWQDELGFLSYQIARVLTLDSIEIANVAWTETTPSSTAAVSVVIFLNFLVTSGVVAFVIHAWHDGKSRSETFVGSTYTALRRLKHEPTPGRKWIDVMGEVEMTEERTLTLQEFIEAYKARVMPTTGPASEAGPFND